MKLYQESLLKIKVLIFFLSFLTNCFSQQFPSQHISIKDGLPDKSIYSIIKDSKGVLWLGTLNGLVSISGNAMKIFKTAEGLPHNSCWQLIEDNNKHKKFSQLHNPYGDGNASKRIIEILKVDKC